MGPKEDTATLCVLSAADLPMEGEGKAAELRWQRLVLVVVCSVFFVLFCVVFYYFLFFS